MRKQKKPLKAVLSVLISVMTVVSCVTPINAVEAEPKTPDYEQSNIENEQYKAGGFTSNDSAKVDSDYRYYFEVNSVKEAKKIVADFDINKDEYELSDKQNGKVIVQADISKTEAKQIENSPLVNNVEKNYNVNGCSEVTDEESLSQWYLSAMNVSEAPEAPENKVKVELLDSGVSYVSALKDVKTVSLGASDDVNPLLQILTVMEPLSQVLSRATARTSRV